MEELRICSVIGEHCGQVLTYGLNKYLQQHNIPIQAQDCIKGEINDRIYLDNYLFAQHRHFILRKCKYLIEAYKTAIWSDSKPDTRLDDRYCGYRFLG